MTDTLTWPFFSGRVAQLKGAARWLTASATSPVALLVPNKTSYSRELPPRGPSAALDGLLPSSQWERCARAARRSPTAAGSILAHRPRASRGAYRKCQSRLGWKLKARQSQLRGWRRVTARAAGLGSQSPCLCSDDPRCRRNSRDQATHRGHRKSAPPISAHRRAARSPQRRERTPARMRGRPLPPLWIGMPRKPGLSDQGTGWRPGVQEKMNRIFNRE
jgi:hypothetical protein